MTTEAHKFPEPQPFTDKARPQIELKPVESGQIKAVGYDEATNTLAVQFRHGKQAIYHYPGVKPETHAAFVGAESLGTFFRDNLRNLPFEKFQAEPEPEQTDVQAAAGAVTQTPVEA